MCTHTHTNAEHVANLVRVEEWLSGEEWVGEKIFQLQLTDLNQVRLWEGERDGACVEPSLCARHNALYLYFHTQNNPLRSNY